MMQIRKIAHSACFFLTRTVYLTCCCGCCSALRPRYKRLVDNIFPASPSDGLVKSNMEKLTFYSLSSPEKLDRIGEYLFQKASRDIYRRRHGFVIIAMEAMDQLLLACHSQSLNLFVESFLKMVQKLLECTEPQLHILATHSFVRFANIEEDTPSYHRRYDFFVSKFSAMCHSNHNDKKMRDKIRLAGIQGLQGVIRKTVSDDLVENIWEAQHMDKIVPSLLYNMQSAEKYETVSCMLADAGDTQASPPLLAEACLRELVGRASFGHIPAVLTPVLNHFDRHELWVPNDFAVHVFKIIMFSIQAQYSYTVVESLMQHLDAGAGGAGGAGAGPGGAGGASRGRVRAARALVLSDIVAIAASDSVGPSVLEIINNLLTNLRTSVARDSEKEPDEKLYQDALINALGEFADHLPDFQKVDIMMFIVSKIPAAKPRARADQLLQDILLKSLLKVGTTYRTVELSKAFPAAFLDCLLRLAAHGGGARATLQRVFHALLDRRGNAPRLQRPTVNFGELGLTVEPCSRADIIFINKNGLSIYSSLYEGLQLESNTVEMAECIYTTLALLACELACADTAPDLLQLVMSIQQSALNNPVLSTAQRYHQHAIVASLLALIPHVMRLPRLAEYASKIIEARSEEAPYLLPPLLEEYDDCQSPSKTPYLMVDQMAVSEALAAHGVAGLAPAAPWAAAPHRHSWLETAGAAQGRDSFADIAGANTELDSANSSPGVQRHPMQSESISLEALRRVAAGPSEAERRDEARRRAALHQAFRAAPFTQLVALTQPKYELRERVEEILNSFPERAPGARPSYQENVPPYQKYFPELFLY